MSSTRKRVAVVAAMAAMGILAPAASASAATTAVPTAGFPAAAGFPGFVGVAPGWGGAVGWQLNFPGLGFGTAAVIGPTIITTAPSSFINTNNQVTAGGAVNGGQAVL